MASNTVYLSVTTKFLSPNFSSLGYPIGIKLTHSKVSSFFLLKPASCPSQLITPLFNWFGQRLLESFLSPFSFTVHICTLEDPADSLFKILLTSLRSKPPEPLTWIIAIASLWQYRAGTEQTIMKGKGVQKHVIWDSSVVYGTAHLTISGAGWTSPGRPGEEFWFSHYVQKQSNKKKKYIQERLKPKCEKTTKRLEDNTGECPSWPCGKQRFFKQDTKKP